MGNKADKPATGPGKQQELVHDTSITATKSMSTTSALKGPPPKVVPSKIKGIVHDSDDAKDASLYSVIFKAKPFGIKFKGKQNKPNLYVADIVQGSYADELGVIIGSQIVKFNDLKVEGYEEKRIFTTLKQQQLPLTMTFRKPMEPNKAKKEDGDNMIYSVKFMRKPFGIHFGKNKQDKNNLYVDKVDEGSFAEQMGVTTGSYIVKFEEEMVEGLGPKKIKEILQSKYGDVLPLNITFKRGNVTKYDEEEEVYIDEDDETLYAVKFTEKPFGLNFGKIKGQKNLYVTGVDEGGFAEQMGVNIGSFVVRFENENVAGLKPKKIMTIYQEKFADKLPLTVVFRRAELMNEEEGPASDPEVVDEAETVGSDDEIVDTPQNEEGDDVEPEQPQNNEEEYAEDEEYEYYEEEYVEDDQQQEM